MAARKTKLACCSAAGTASSSPASDEQLASLAWALAHPARIRILRLLIGRERCVCGEIVDSLPLAQSTVSQHLKILKESGLIQGAVDGPKVCYCIDPARLNELKSLISTL